MRHFDLLRLRISLAALAIGLAPVSGVGGEGAGGSMQAGGPLRSDPCGFYRGQAYGRGLTHVATEMLWACEAIEARREAEMPLSDRLLAVEGALERYREAVIAAGAAAFVRDRARGVEGGHVATGDAAKATLAETTGMLAALEAIRTGF